MVRPGGGGRTLAPLNTPLYTTHNACSRIDYTVSKQTEPLLLLLLLILLLSVNEYY